MFVWGGRKRRLRVCARGTTKHPCPAASVRLRIPSVFMQPSPTFPIPISLLLLLILPFASPLPLPSPPPTCPSAVVALAFPYSQINASHDKTNRYGLEDGMVVRRQDGGFTMITAAMYGDPFWIRMRLDLFKSSDGLQWVKSRSIRVSDANFNGTSTHSSSWGPMLAFDASNKTWMLSYVGYRGAPSNSSGWLGNFDGRMYVFSPPPFSQCIVVTLCAFTRVMLSTKAMLGWTLTSGTEAALMMAAMLFCYRLMISGPTALGRTPARGCRAPTA